MLLHILLQTKVNLRYLMQIFEHTSHSIELADGSRTTGIVVGKGVASVNLWDTQGMVQSVELRNALYIPSYKQDIFSVKAATERGATVIFTPDHAGINCF